MAEFHVFEKGGDAEARGYGEHGDSRYRRSRSSADRTQKIPRGGVSHPIEKDQKDSPVRLQFISHPIEKDQNDSPVSPTSVRASSASRLQSPFHDNLTCKYTNSYSSHRASLEKDVDQLQLRLQQEKSLRLLLERAMGRASSTLSPGHRHFAAQTKDLIAEVDSLEVEVTSREQHVLSLYRNIFEQYVSRPSSEQNSGIASPAHTRHESRKHPSIISSAFCSSKKFPLRTLQALISNIDLRKRIFGSNCAPLSSGKGNAFSEKKSDSAKAHEMFSTMEKTPVLWTLKDHLHQCPSKLSEEMVRCMATVYCWLRIASSVNAEKSRSPLLSRSSTHTVQPLHGIIDDQDWSCKSAVEISCISPHNRRSSHASYAITNYRVLVEKLERVNVSQMECDAQIAFGINVHNALMMHVYLAHGIPLGSLSRLALFQKAAYNIGGHIISTDAIEQAIFCIRTPRISQWLESISAALRKKSGEEIKLINSKLGVTDSQPLVCFALCTGALSDPALKVYSASNIREELNVAEREFLQANVIVKKSRKVYLAKLMKIFSKEASISLDDLLGWVMENVDKKLHDSIQNCLDHKSGKKPSRIIEWLPYSTRFRYVFSKDLIDKPWWV